MGIWDLLIRGSEAAAPAVAAGLEGRRLGEYERRKMQEQRDEEEFEREMRRKMWERAVAETNVAQQRENRLSRPGPLTATLMRGGARVEGVPLDQVSSVLGKLPQEPAPSTGGVRTVTGDDGIVYAIGRNPDGSERATPLTVNGRPLRAPPPRRAPAPVPGPTSSDRRTMLERIRGRAELIAREGANVTPRALSVILRGSFPGADADDIERIVADMLTRTGSRGTTGTASDVVTPRTAGSASARVAPDSLPGPKSQGRGGTRAAPAAQDTTRSATPADVQRRALELHAQGLSEDEVVAALRRERLIH